MAVETLTKEQAVERGWEFVVRLEDDDLVDTRQR